MSFALGDIDQADDDSAARVQDELTIIKIVSDGERQVKEVHL
jgi:hypothetical protein